MTPAMVATARLLMACPDCPEGLAMHVVSGERSVFRCAGCDEGWDAATNRCWNCGRGERRKVVIRRGDTVPDLTSAANGGVLYVALRPELRPACRQAPLGYEVDVWDGRVEGREWLEAEHLAHAAALALLAVSR